MTFKIALAAMTALGLMAGSANAQVEKPKLELGVGGKPLLYYLPLTIAETKGYFKAEGLDVTINDFGGGAKSLQSLMGGSVDVVTGAYEHTIRMQAKNQPLQAVIELGRFPGIVLMVKKELEGKVKTAADLKGLKIGVTAPGSSTNFFVNYLIAKAKPDEIAAAVPEAYFLGDKPLYLQAVKASMETYSRTGIISADGMKSAHDMLKQFDAEIAAANIDLNKTFDDRFIKAVKK